MPVNTAWLEMDSARVTSAIEDAVERLVAGGEAVLDFSAVERMDVPALQAMERLAAKADETGAKVVLRAVSVRTYKTLKLMKLAGRFSFAR